ncbi:MAG: undecaprenyl-diphosphate phosphatase [Gammaproteobacteria bacterium]|nr:undecaprenyl-diphosphate phosphatase [Gammaproteobacteria bacterium]NIR82743.1 undecaprenyl-diphosphate phosphatase [Gammaproteobacteria bacterium]NIR89607.1 undecaprenyl-diphosphate phosphatase [Gammaproteobacteria bacterium]NIU03903.1 undecaprenyl-diphosphate phosphatase [Gammaproteobacteria bacterium]NIV51219.1 undecaprenyl-diphosphate phosphatase [Gammaproteobacteria bacterium]
MDALQVLVLALVQGITEFLPISSSAHLVLLPGFVGWRDQGLAFDVAVHLGTLVAVVSYFRRDLGVMLRDWARSLVHGRPSAEGRLVWAVLAGTVPVAVAGWLVRGHAEAALRSPAVIAAASAVFALLLWWADARARGARDERALRWRDVLIIGCAQALALVPGTSRSGITITAGLMVGLSRTGAARFAFLLAIPVIALAGAFETTQALSGAIEVEWGALVSGTAIAAVSAYLCIRWFLGLVQRMSLTPFVVYRLVLAAVILISL